MYSICFIIKASTMEHPNWWAVSKLQFYKSFHYYSFIYHVNKRCKANKSIKFLTCFLIEIIDMFIKLQVSLNCYSSKYFLFDSVLIGAVDGSLQLKRRWLLSQLTFIKLLLNYLKSSSDNTSIVLITDSLFSLTVYVALWSA